MKKPRQQLSREMASRLIEAERIEQIKPDRLLEIIHRQERLIDNIPDRIGQRDPRTEELILFNPSRATRPNSSGISSTAADCPVCKGDTTRILDVVGLSDGFSFINSNLYPAIYPHKGQLDRKKSQVDQSEQFDAWGLHFLQWTSSIHDQDWHNMHEQDLQLVLNRLGILEETLLRSGFSPAEKNAAWGDESTFGGYVSIMKNDGNISGGSLEHGHQQIIYSREMPRQMREHLNYEHNHGRVISAHLLQSNPPNLTVYEDDRVVLLVPYFMRRPYDMALILKDTTNRYIHQLSDEEKLCVSRGWKTATRALQRVIADIGLSCSYNVITHNGPGAGLYFEFLPHTQSDGGFEKLGLSVCQSNPTLAANLLRKARE